MSGGDGHNIELEVPSHGKWGTIANVVATTVAILVAVASILKPNDPVNKSSYEELKGAIEKNSQEISKNHEDTMALKNYLEGYMKGVGHINPIPGPSSSAVIVPMDKSKLNGPVVAAPPSNLGPKTVVLIPTVTPPPVPPMSPPPQHKKLPEYSDLGK